MCAPDSLRKLQIYQSLYIHDHLENAHEIITHKITLLSTVDQKSLSFYKLHISVPLKDFKDLISLANFHWKEKTSLNLRPVSLKVMM